MHYNKGKPKGSLIRKADLLPGGSLSVWRLADGDEPALAAIKSELEPQQGSPQALAKVYAPTAREVRDIQLPDVGRVFSVVDDCSTDNEGGAHPLHAGIKLCAKVLVNDENDLIFVQAKAQLFRVLTAAKTV
ncbi:MAG: hypothetical protein KIT02_10190 [Devosia sp.]|uniref:hypothetical protein n=1 Tax=Devosia sp. TaxID=1871048 RepID=UPI0024CBE5EC|nr:hypothetical protein [Devosia sp.]UYN98335.1 MAG: hypothetical protein KIT02_10190 [Devosia sp.]